MEKKSRKSIIIAVTSLLLVTLLLVGLTYAYYKTRIIGNESTDPSISVTSKKLGLSYADGNAVLSTTGLIEPGFTASKTFYVENTGDEEAKFSIVLDNVNNSFTRKSDWTYTLTQNGVTEPLASGTVPSETTNLTYSTSIASKVTNTYILTITYAIKDNEDQSIDMGAKLSFRVNITNEVSEDITLESVQTWETATEGTLLYALKTNQPTGTEETTPGNPATINEKRILTIEDDYGPSYVFRGAVDNNYVTYSNMCWRIVRVQGDGTIKIVLADGEHPCGQANGYSAEANSAYINGGYVPYKANSSHNINDFLFENSDIPQILNNWAQNKNLDMTKLTVTDWCNIQSDIYKPTLKCNPTEIEGITEPQKMIYQNKLGILSIDEIVFAGGGDDYDSRHLYLATNADGSSWSLSLRTFSTDYIVMWRLRTGHPHDDDILADNNIRPSVVLKNNTTLDTSVIDQNGTIDKPYVIA